MDPMGYNIGKFEFQKWDQRVTERLAQHWQSGPQLEKQERDRRSVTSLLVCQPLWQQWVLTQPNFMIA